LQSQVPEHAELQLLLSMVTPLGWLERVPTYKEALENVKGKDLHTFGFLGYPVLQAADIVIYDADLVPVGEDQVAHVELTREIVRTFNFTFGLTVSDAIFNDNQTLNRVLSALPNTIGLPPSGSGGTVLPSEFDAFFKATIREGVKRNAQQTGHENLIELLGADGHFVELTKVLREPNAMLTHTPRIPGTDGRKMSKSYDNFIALSETDDAIRKKTRRMVTDPARKLRTDPGNPDVCPVFDWHKLFSTPEVIQRIRRDCTTAAIGCVDCKQVVADALIKWIEPVRERRRAFEAKPAEVLGILDEGSKKARAVATSTMERVREAVFGWKKTRESISSKAGS
jgi:tryptophanyl-tRNA synthetase